MNIEQDMTCSYCNKIYQDPVFLNCCGNHICQEHVDTILSSIDTSEKAACPFCNTELENKTFIINKLLKSLIEKRELHNLRLDPLFENTLKMFKDEMNNLEKVVNDPDSVIYESILKVKRQVDLDREQLKEKIDNQADEIIKKLESLEIEFIRESKTRVKEVFDDNFKKSLNNQFEEYEKTLNSIAKTNEEREKKRLDIEETLKILELKQTQFKTKLFSNKSIKYEPFSKNKEDIFGKLDVSDANWQAIECEVLIATINKRNSKINTIVSSVMIQNLMFGTEKQQLELIKLFRRHLSKQPNLFVDIRSGIVSKFVEFLRGGNINIQYEAAFALSIITAGNSLQTSCVVDAGALPVLIKLLSSPSGNVQEQAVWCLGNIVGEGPECRDWVLDLGILSPLLQILSKQTNLTLKRNAVWCLSILFRGKIPLVEFRKIEPALPVLALLLNNEDKDILAYTCWALSNLSDAPNRNIQEIIDLRVCPRLVELLNHSSFEVVQPTLIAVGNIVAGNDAQTKVIVDCNALEHLLKLLNSPHQSIIKDTCWAISNIAAGDDDQIQALIDANMFPKLIEILATGGRSTKIEVAWAVVNLVSGGSLDQIRCLVELNVIPPLCEFLNLVGDEQVTVQGVLDSLYILFLLALKNSDIPYAFSIKEYSGFNKIECLISHQNEDISKKAVLITQLFSYQDEAEDENDEEIISQTDSIINSNSPKKVNPIDPGSTSISVSSAN